MSNQTIHVLFVEPFKLAPSTALCQMLCLPSALWQMPPLANHSLTINHWLTLFTNPSSIVQCFPGDIVAIKCAAYRMLVGATRDPCSQLEIMTTGWWGRWEGGGYNIICMTTSIRYSQISFLKMHPISWVSLLVQSSLHYCERISPILTLLSKCQTRYVHSTKKEHQIYLMLWVRFAWQKWYST